MTSPGKLFTDTLVGTGLYNIDAMSMRLLASLGSHVANLRQNHRRIDYASGNPVIVESPLAQPILPLSAFKDIRAHFVIVGSPATGKTLMGHLLFDRQIGVVANALPNHSIGRVTEAGLVGQKKWMEDDRSYEWERGALWTHKDDVLFLSEFDTIITALKSSHSRNLLNTMLDALDSGDVRTNIGGVDDSYRTHSTVIGGTQPDRFEKVTGFERRFIFMRNPPVAGKHEDGYRRGAYNFNRYEPKAEVTRNVRDTMRNRILSIGKLERVRFSNELDSWLMMNKSVPFSSLGVLKRALLGYTLFMADEVGSEFRVEKTKQAEVFVKEYTRSRGQVIVHPEVFNIIRENLDPKGEVLKSVQRDLHMSKHKADSAIRECLQYYEGMGIRIVVARRGQATYRIPTGMDVEALRRAKYDVISEVGFDGWIIKNHTGSSLSEHSFEYSYDYEGPQ